MNFKQMIEIVETLAEERKTTRNKLLKACGVRSYVDNLIKERTPKVDTVEKIAEYCDVSIDYLLGRTDKPGVNR